MKLEDTIRSKSRWMARKISKIIRLHFMQSNTSGSVSGLPSSKKEQVSLMR